MDDRNEVPVMEGTISEPAGLVDITTAELLASAAPCGVTLESLSVDCDGCTFVDEVESAALVCCPEDVEAAVRSTFIAKPAIADLRPLAL